MKKLSDYKGDEAIELWGDLLDPVQKILADSKVSKSVRDSKSIIDIAKAVFKTHPSEVEQILTRIDDTPVNGLNLFTRFISVLQDVAESNETASFFGFAGQAKTASASTGSVMENIEAGAK